MSWWTYLWQNRLKIILLSIIFYFPSFEILKAAWSFQAILPSEIISFFSRPEPFLNHGLIFLYLVIPFLFSCLTLFLARLTRKKRGSFSKGSLEKCSLQNELILASVGEGILGLDHSGRHIFVNPAAARMLGYEVEELMGRHSHDTWHRLRMDGQLYRYEDCPIYQTYVDGVARCVANEVFWRKDGTSFPVEYTSNPVYEKGKSVGVVINFRDITSQKRAEENRSRVEALLTSIGDGVFAVDLNGRVTLMNSVAYNLTGYTFAEVQGKYYADVFKFLLEKDQDSPYPPFIEEAIKAKTIKTIIEPTLLVRKDGTKIPISDSAAPVKDSHGNILGCIVVFRDTTLERELEKAKDEFLSVAAHQMRTPLGNMRWNLEMLLSGDLGQVSGQFREVLVQIYQSNQRLIRLVNGLLHVSRIDQNKIKDELRAVNVIDVFKDVMKEMEYEGKSKGISLTLKFPEGQIPDITIDPQRLRDVVQNLLSNAVKYNRLGGTVTVTVALLGEFIQAKISDTGIGIPKKDQAEVFTKFFRATNAKMSQTEGTGLGLYVVKSYIEGWGGEIFFESQEGSGTTFTFTLPLKPKPSNSTN
jgi:PAS domain S-box-containing protein